MRPTASTPYVSAPAAEFAAHSACPTRDVLGRCPGHREAEPERPVETFYYDPVASPIETAIRECADVQWALGCNDAATTGRR
jgi:hypothetical protein